jgi:quinol monooxygenase YgiN
MSRPGKPAAFVMIPEFVVKPAACIDALLSLARDDIGRSVADEPGCRQFDVVQMEGAPLHVLSYEAHDSRAAFEAHPQTPRLARFREGFPALVLEKRPVRFASRHHG